MCADWVILLYDMLFLFLFLFFLRTGGASKHQAKTQASNPKTQAYTFFCYLYYYQGSPWIAGEEGGLTPYLKF